MTTVSNIISRKQVLDTSTDSKFLPFSDTGGDKTGVWVLQFVPDATTPFDGNISIQGRIQGQQAFDDSVPFAPVPFRAAILNGAISDYSTKTSTDVLTGHSLVVVPATGLAIAILVQCTSGKGVLYSYPRQGDGAIV